MEVYVEDVIVDNFIMTYMISSLSYFATKRAQSRKRKICGAIFSTLISLLYPFVINTYLLSAIKICVWLILSSVLYVKKQKFVLSAMVLLSITFCVAGGITSVGNLLKNGEVYSLQRITLAGFVVVSIMRIFLVKISRFRAFSTFFSSITLQICGIKRKLKSYTDTGNLLIDEKSGLNIVVITSKALVYFITSKTPNPIKSNRYINYSTIDGTKRKLLIIDGCKVVVNDKEKDVVVGVSHCKLIDDADVIIGPNLLDEKE